MIQTAAKPITAARFLVEQLTAWGVKTIYGVTGDATLYWMDALAKQDRIRYIGCRLETTAALMASAEAKLTGQLTVCTATSGPGIANLLLGLGDAAQDRAPVLAITGQVARKDLGTGAKQEIDQQRLIDPITVYSSLVADAAGLPVQLNQAMKKALSQGGVAHLSIPKDLWLEPVDHALFPPAPSRPIPAVDPASLASAQSRIQQAQSPIILAGRGIQHAQAEVLRLAEMLQAPIITTMPARSYIPNDHSLFVGGLGQAGSEIASDLLNEADLCLVLGATWWPQDYVSQSISLIQVDAIPDAIGITKPVDISLVGEMREVLTRLHEGLMPTARDQWQQRVQTLRQQWKKKVEKEASQEGAPIAPQRVIAALQRCIAPDAIIALDVGDHALWFNRIFQAQAQEILLSGRWRTLGFALPGAMAAGLSQPHRQVVAIVGDGGFGTTMADLITAVGYDIPMTIILMNNGSFAMERNRMIQAGLSTLGSELHNPDFVQLAQAFGAEGVRVEEPSALEPALNQALASRRVSLVDIHCDDPIVPHTKI
jgi:pyruvate oxidase